MHGVVPLSNERDPMRGFGVEMDLEAFGTAEQLVALSALWMEIPFNVVIRVWVDLSWRHTFHEGSILDRRGYIYPQHRCIGSLHFRIS